jgi:hypothetical protein
MLYSFGVPPLQLSFLLVYMPMTCPLRLWLVTFGSANFRETDNKRMLIEQAPSRLGKHLAGPDQNGKGAQGANTFKNSGQEKRRPVEREYVYTAMLVGAAMNHMVHYTGGSSCIDQRHMAVQLIWTDLCAYLIQNVVMTGGGSLVVGFAEGLSNELTKVFASIFCGPRKYATWLIFSTKSKIVRARRYHRGAWVYFGKS